MKPAASDAHYLVLCPNNSRWNSVKISRTGVHIQYFSRYPLSCTKAERSKYFPAISVLHDNVLMHFGAGGHNAQHYVLYSRIWNKRGGSKLNCCKIWPLGKHDIIYWSHITGVKVLVIAERGLLLVIMIAADVGGRDTEKREMKNPSHFKVCSSNFRLRSSHHNMASTENTAFLLSIHAAFLCSWCWQHISTERIFSTGLDVADSHCFIHSRL